MKKIFGILLLLILAVGIYLWPREKPASLTTESSLENKTVQVPGAPKKFFLSARPPLITTDLSPTCLKLNNFLSDIDFNVPIETILDTLSLELFTSCKQTQFSHKVFAVQEACFKNSVKTYCLPELLYIRALLRTESAKEPFDQAMLADLIMREFAKKEIDEKRLYELSEELLGRAPNNQSFQKLWALSKYMVSKDPTKISKQFKEELVQRLDPEVLNEESFQPVRIMLEVGKNFDKIEPLARENAINHPNSSAAQEFLALSLWRQGKRDESFEYLQKAVALSPEDTWLAEMWKNLKNSPNPRMEDYKGRIHFGVKWEEFYN